MQCLVRPIIAAASEYGSRAFGGVYDLMTEQLVAAQRGDLVFRGELILPDRTVRHRQLVCRGGIIAEITADARHDGPAIEGRYIAPGYIDMHVHGAGGSDYMDGCAEAVRIANRVHARHGTTTIFP